MAAVVILATALCGACAAENLPARIVGRVVRRRNGVVLWIVKRRGYGAGAVLLSDPMLSLPLVHDRVYAVCNRHGPGSVSAADVIGKRGKVIIDFSASA
jgi:hypothetical protein